VIRLFQFGGGGVRPGVRGGRRGLTAVQEEIREAAQGAAVRLLEGKVGDGQVLPAARGLAPALRFGGRFPGLALRELQGLSVSRELAGRGPSPQHAVLGGFGARGRPAVVLHGRIYRNAGRTHLLLPPGSVDVLGLCLDAGRGPRLFLSAVLKAAVAIADGGADLDGVPPLVVCPAGLVEEALRVNAVKLLQVLLLAAAPGEAGCAAVLEGHWRRGRGDVRRSRAAPSVRALPSPVFGRAVDVANLLVGQVGGLEEAALGAGRAAAGAGRPAGDAVLAAAVLPQEGAGGPMRGALGGARGGAREGGSHGMERAGGEGALGLLG